MKYNVLKSFIDKDTGIGYNAGNTFESTDSERVSYLSEEGFIKTAKTQKQQEESPGITPLDELKIKAKELGIKGYTEMSEEELTVAIKDVEAEKASE